MVYDYQYGVEVVYDYQYGVEVVYDCQEAAPSGHPALPARYAAGDSGVDHLAALPSNTKGVVPRLVNGRPIKSTNHYSKKRQAALELQAALGPEGTTARVERFTAKRTRRITPSLQTASKAISALLVAEGLGTLVVGKNPGWKQEAEGGRVNNQHCVGLPPARVISLVEDKAKRAGICLVLHEESSTSTASFLDGDALPTYDPKQEGTQVFSGTRVKRGLYRARDGRTLTADVNGSDNILRKALPDAFGKGIAAVVVWPVWLTLAWSVQPCALAAA